MRAFTHEWSFSSREIFVFNKTVLVRDGKHKIAQVFARFGKISGLVWCRHVWTRLALIFSWIKQNSARLHIKMITSNIKDGLTRILAKFLLTPRVIAREIAKEFKKHKWINSLYHELSFDYTSIIYSGDKLRSCLCETVSVFADLWNFSWRSLIRFPVFNIQIWNNP